MGLQYGESFVIPTRTVFLRYTRPTDGRTDGWAIAYNALIIYAVAR